MPFALELLYIKKAGLCVKSTVRINRDILNLHKFSFNELYGFISWKRMEKRQSKTA